ncbi:MAG TPA: hypothetical protein VI685_15375 [Candidatus Angelobacter sp.]
MTTDNNKKARTKMLYSVAIFWMAVVSMAVPANAQITVGGHVGFVIPWVTHANGNTNTVFDNFAIGFPFGVTFKGQGRFAVDFEFVPSISTNPHEVTLTVDPGILWRLEHGFTTGVRIAFDVNSSRIGFIPLLNKSWKFKDQSHFFKAYFVEADLPVKFDRPTGGPATNSVTFATHFGLGF